MFRHRARQRRGDLGMGVEQRRDMLLRDLVEHRVADRTHGRRALLAREQRHLAEKVAGAQITGLAQRSVRLRHVHAQVSLDDDEHGLPRLALFHDDAAGRHQADHDLPCEPVERGGVEGRKQIDTAERLHPMGDILMVELAGGRAGDEDVLLRERGRKTAVVQVVEHVLEEQMPRLARHHLRRIDRKGDPVVDAGLVDRGDENVGRRARQRSPFGGRHARGGLEHADGAIGVDREVELDDEVVPRGLIRRAAIEDHGFGEDAVGNDDDVVFEGREPRRAPVDLLHDPHDRVGAAAAQLDEIAGAERLLQVDRDPREGIENEAAHRESDQQPERARGRDQGRDRLIEDESDNRDDRNRVDDDRRQLAKQLGDAHIGLVGGQHFPDRRVDDPAEQERPREPGRDGEHIGDCRAGIDGQSQREPVDGGAARRDGGEQRQKKNCRHPRPIDEGFDVVVEPPSHGSGQPIQASKVLASMARAQGDVIEMTDVAGNCLADVLSASSCFVSSSTCRVRPATFASRGMPNTFPS